MSKRDRLCEKQLFIARTWSSISARANQLVIRRLGDLGASMADLLACMNTHKQAAEDLMYQ